MAIEKANTNDKFVQKNSKGLQHIVQMSLACRYDDPVHNGVSASSKQSVKSDQVRHKATGNDELGKGLEEANMRIKSMRSTAFA
jgi:hypothetical protein